LYCHNKLGVRDIALTKLTKFVSTFSGETGSTESYFPDDIYGSLFDSCAETLEDVRVLRYGEAAFACPNVKTLYVAYSAACGPRPMPNVERLYCIHNLEDCEFSKFPGLREIIYEQDSIPATPDRPGIKYTKVNDIREAILEN
jgi:hypothetical protein